MPPNRSKAGGRRAFPDALPARGDTLRRAMAGAIPAAEDQFIKLKNGRLQGATLPAAYGGVTNGTDNYTAVIFGELLQLLAGAGIGVAVNTSTGTTTVEVRSGSGKVLGRTTAGTGPIEELAATTAGLAMLAAASATAQTALLDVFTSVANGLVPASGGGTAKFLRADVTWAAPPFSTSFEVLRAIDLGGV